MSAAFASDCASDPNECTPKDLCEVATEVTDGNKLWSPAATSSKHVSFAQELGMNCGVVELKDPCDTDPKQCKINQLCEKATIEDGGTKSWNSEAEAYVEVAKEYGLECGVKTNTKHNKVFSFKEAFKSQSKLKRKQIQYALKKLNYYSSGIDGLWGNGTKSGLEKFAYVKKLSENNELEIFDKLLDLVDVPSSFETKQKPKKKERASNDITEDFEKRYGLLKKYPKNYFKIPSFSITSDQVNTSVNGETFSTKECQRRLPSGVGEDLYTSIYYGLLRIVKTASKKGYNALHSITIIKTFGKNYSCSGQFTISGVGYKR